VLLTKKSKAKSKVTKPATVKKIIHSPHPDIPEKAEITLKDGDDLYREIRIDNMLETDKGEKVRLVEGAKVDVTVEAPPESTAPKQK
jgi:hypothetical protein